jgi:hypothetical protein
MIKCFAVFLFPIKWSSIVPVEKVKKIQLDLQFLKLLVKFFYLDKEKRNKWKNKTSLLDGGLLWFPQYHFLILLSAIPAE